MTETFEPERILAALNAAGVAYVIVGGIAVAAHGAIRATADVDIVPDPSATNLDSLAAVLNDLGAEHPVDDVLTGESLSRPVSFKLRTRFGDLQLLNRMPAVPPYAQLRDQAITVELAAGVRAVVCSLADLRSMKRASGRPKDLIDIAELDEIHGPI